MKDLLRKHKRELQKAQRSGNLELSKKEPGFTTVFILVPKESVPEVNLFEKMLFGQESQFEHIEKIMGYCGIRHLTVSMSRSLAIVII